MLDSLAPHSRVWIFQSDRKLNVDEVNHIQIKMSEFIPTWASHGNDLYGEFSINENFFIIVGVDEKRSPTSGCSIDTLTRVIKQLGEELKIDFFNRLNITYLNSANEIELVDMGTFKNLMKKDIVGQGTWVFNNLIENKEELETKWKSRVKDSWHKNLLQIL